MSCDGKRAGMTRGNENSGYGLCGLPVSDEMQADLRTRIRGIVIASHLESGDLRGMAWAMVGIRPPQLPLRGRAWIPTIASVADLWEALERDRLTGRLHRLHLRSIPARSARTRE